MAIDKLDRSKLLSCIHIAICDDEDRERKKYKEKIEKIARKHHIDTNIVCYDNARSFLFYMEDMEYLPDVIYMDIHMPELDGMKLSKILREKKTPKKFSGELIFLTCDKEYVWDAFDVNAFHYIVKEVTPIEKFEEIFLRVANRVMEHRKKTLLIRGIGEYRKIEIKQIHYFEVFRRIITVHYGEPEECFEFYSSMNKLEEMVFPFGFLRAQRAFILRVGAIHTLNKSKAILENGAEIPISENYYANIKTAFDNMGKR
ncbi:LytR/AlgR family response regulator transcription factor [Hespellia stercorisuis]|uniref:Stage 0 sporulation protein A homolog n=1 Tax=Hespellia stercorisuis DSM 15480 TaxID=1121950 RepID=A0A1M6UN29_9FIRM|nr:LytTR family DNA-binding domain-containing protein [Hespellia stercorisuis]SHK70510.1 two component transcriptional regulator, LytTR family [Hespellia stercorisuis DSM 15480]